MACERPPAAFGGSPPREGETRAKRARGSFTHHRQLETPKIHFFPIEPYLFLRRLGSSFEKAPDELFATLLIVEIDCKIERCHKVQVSRPDASTSSQQNIQGFRRGGSDGKVQRSLAIAIRHIWIKACFQQQRNGVVMTASDSPRQHAVIVITKYRFEVGRLRN